MADKKVPTNEPGIAAFASESWNGQEEPRYGEGVPTTTHETVKSTAGIVLPLYAVVSIAEDGEITLAEHDGTDGSNATAIMATAAALNANESMSLPFYREGHWEMDALVWDDSFDTDAKKAKAFEGSVSPTIFISKKLFKADAITV